jgi:triacylglycerol lipase
VLLVHGIWDSARRLEPLRRGLERRGLRWLVPLDLRPSTGSAPLERLGEQVRARAEELAAQAPEGRVDVVGFSMGALVTRWWIQRGGGQGLARVFVSISGPHQGTLGAWALPLAGARQMRPGSEFLRDLAADPSPWGPVAVHCLYTPLDLMILPPTSSVLAGARSVEAIPVALHRWMLSDERVLDAVARRLQ